MVLLDEHCADLVEGGGYNDVVALGVVVWFTEEVHTGWGAVSLSISGWEAGGRGMGLT